MTPWIFFIAIITNYKYQWPWQDLVARYCIGPIGKFWQDLGKILLWWSVNLMDCLDKILARFQQNLALTLASLLYKHLAYYYSCQNLSRYSNLVSCQGYNINNYPLSRNTSTGQFSLWSGVSSSLMHLKWYHYSGSQYTLSFNQNWESNLGMQLQVNWYVLQPVSLYFLFLRWRNEYRFSCWKESKRWPRMLSWSKDNCHISGVLYWWFLRFIFFQ